MQAYHTAASWFLHLLIPSVLIHSLLAERFRFRPSLEVDVDEIDVEDVDVEDVLDVQVVELVFEVLELDVLV